MYEISILLSLQASAFSGCNQECVCCTLYPVSDNVNKTIHLHLFPNSLVNTISVSQDYVCLRRLFAGKTWLTPLCVLYWFSFLHFVSCPKLFTFMVCLVGLQTLQSRSLSLRQVWTKTLRMREKEPMHLFTCVLIRLTKLKTPEHLSKLPPILSTAPPPKRVLCLIKSLLHSHPKAKRVRPVNSHQHGIQYPDIEQRLVEMSKKKNTVRPDEMNRGGVTLF